MNLMNTKSNTDLLNKVAFFEAIVREHELIGDKAQVIWDFINRPNPPRDTLVLSYARVVAKLPEAATGRHMRIFYSRVPRSC